MGFLSNGTVIVQPPARTICEVLQTFQNDLTTALQPKWFCRDLFQHPRAWNEGGRNRRRRSVQAALHFRFVMLVKGLEV